MTRSCLYIFIASALIACGDPPLLVTPLPNGYNFHSNGGEFGYIKNPDGLRLAEYFGIRNDGRETWCTDFSWESDIVICKLIEYSQHGFDASHTEFFVLDTKTSEVRVFPDQASAQNFWAARFNSGLPQLHRHYPSTSEK
jgi:hypothetical protein